MYCRRCGAEIPAVKFCPKCGAPNITAQTEEKTLAAPFGGSYAAQNGYSATPAVNEEENTVLLDAFDGEKTVAARDVGYYADDMDATVAARSFGAGCFGNNNDSTVAERDVDVTRFAGDAEATVAARDVDATRFAGNWVNAEDDGATQFAGNLDATAAVRGFDAREYEATMAAPYMNYQNEPQYYAPREEYVEPVAPQKTKKKKKPMTPLRKFRIAVSTVLIILVLLGSVLVGFVAFTPKFKFMVAVCNTLLNTKSFDLTVVNESYINKELDGSGAHTVTDCNGNRWEFASGEYNTLQKEEFKLSVAFGKKNEDTVGCVITDFTEKTTGTGNAKVAGSKGAYSQVKIDESNFDTSYIVIAEGEFIKGELEGKNGKADPNSGDFVSCSSDVFWAYNQKQDGYFEVAKNNRLNLKAVIESVNSAEDSNRHKLETKELAKIAYDLVTLAFDDGAVKIKNTRIEDGMTKYTVEYSYDKLDECKIKYAKQNSEYKKYLESIIVDKVNGTNQYEWLVQTSGGEEGEPIEFVIGTKGMRIVHVKNESEIQDGSYVRGSRFEINLTNINKKMDFSSQLSDVKVIAQDWKESYTLCETVEDYEDYITKKSAA